MKILKEDFEKENFEEATAAAFNLVYDINRVADNAANLEKLLWESTDYELTREVSDFVDDMLDKAHHLYAKLQDRGVISSYESNYF